MNSRDFHHFIGAFLALPIAVITITGMALGLRDSIVHSQPPYKLERGVHQEVSVSVDKALSKIVARYPDLNVKSVFLPLSSDQSLRSIWRLGKNLNQDFVFFSDPESGSIIFEGDSTRAKVFAWILSAHRGAIAGVTGKIFISMFGLLLFLLWPTGVLIRFQKTKRQRGAFLVRRIKSQPLKFHRSAGFLGGFLVSFMGLSGALLNFNKVLIQSLDPVPVAQEAITGVQNIQTIVSTDFTSEIALAKAARTHAQLQSLYFSESPKTEILFYFSDNSRVYLNSNTGQIVKIMSPQSSWIHLFYPLHSGRFFGVFHLIFSWVVGILLLGLIASGFRGRKKTLTLVSRSIRKENPLLSRPKSYATN